MVNSPSNFEVVLDELEAFGVVSGLHTRSEKRFLWNLARRRQPGVVVEIGSFEGYSTIILGRALNCVGELYAIDPHTGRISEGDEKETPFIGNTWSRFNENIQRSGISDIVTALKMRSEEAAQNWGKPVRLLWIDGSHRYEDVKKDFLLWRPHLVSGGVVVFHDCWAIGVRKAVIEHVLGDRAFGEFRFVPCCMFYTTYFGDRRLTVSQRILRVSQRTLWRLIFGLRSIVGTNMTLKQWLTYMLRRFG